MSQKAFQGKGMCLETVGGWMCLETLGSVRGTNKWLKCQVPKLFILTESKSAWEREREKR